METHWIVDIMSVIFFMPTQEFGGAVMMTISLKLVIYHRGFILQWVTKNKKKVDFRINRCNICCLYQNNPSEKYSPFFFKNSPTCPKPITWRKLLKIWTSLENILGLDKKLAMKFKQVFLLLKTSFKLPLKITYLVRKERKNHFGWMGID